MSETTVFVHLTDRLHKAEYRIYFYCETCMLTNHFCWNHFRSLYPKSHCFLHIQQIFIAYFFLKLVYLHSTPKIILTNFNSTELENFAVFKILINMNEFDTLLGMEVISTTEQ